MDEILAEFYQELRRLAEKKVTLLRSHGRPARDTVRISFEELSPLLEKTAQVRYWVHKKTILPEIVRELSKRGLLGVTLYLRSHPRPRLGGIEIDLNALLEERLPSSIRPPLSPDEELLLKAVKKAGGRVSLKELKRIAREFGVSPVKVSPLTAILLSKGYLNREVEQRGRFSYSLTDPYPKEVKEKLRKALKAIANGEKPASDDLLVASLIRRTLCDLRRGRSPEEIAKILEMPEKLIRKVAKAIERDG